MSRLIEFQTEEGTEILVELDKNTPGVGPAGDHDDLPVKAQKKFEETMAALVPIANAIHSKVKSVTKPPKEITVEFGLKISGKGNLIITSSEAEAHIKTTFRWILTNPQPEE